MDFLTNSEMVQAPFLIKTSKVFVPCNIYYSIFSLLSIKRVSNFHRHSPKNSGCLQEYIFKYPSLRKSSYPRIILRIAGFHICRRNFGIRNDLDFYYRDTDAKSNYEYYSQNIL